MKKTLRNSLFRYLADFLIVFAGVYIAFLFSEVKANRDMHERRKQIHSALVDEVTLIGTQGRRTAESIDRQLREYRDGIDNGEFPIPRPMNRPVYFSPHMWNAVIQSDGLNLLDVGEIRYISLYYNNVQQVVNHINAYKDLTQTWILPNQDRGVDTFYDRKNKVLRLPYRWYLDELEAISRECRMISVNADSLLSFMNR